MEEGEGYGGFSSGGGGGIGVGGGGGAQAAARARAYRPRMDYGMKKKAAPDYYYDKKRMVDEALDRREAAKQRALILSLENVDPDSELGRLIDA